MYDLFAEERVDRVALDVSAVEERANLSMLPLKLDAVSATSAVSGDVVRLLSEAILVEARWNLYDFRVR